MARNLMLALVIAAVGAILAVAKIPDHQLPNNPLFYVFTRIFAVEIVLLFLYQVLVFPNFVDPLRHLPSPRGAWPVVGHVLQRLRTKPRFQALSDCAIATPNDGLIRLQGVFNVSRLLVTSPKALAEIMNTRVYDFEKPKNASQFLSRILGDGLIVVEGDEHKFLRKNVMPSFSFRHIKDLYPVFWGKSTQMVSHVKDEIRADAARTDEKASAPTAIVEIRQWASRLTLDIIGMAAMGRDIQALKNSDDPLMRNYEELFTPSVGQTIYFFLNIVGLSWLLKILPMNITNQIDRICAALRSTCLDMVQEKKLRLKESTESERLDILALLIKSNNFSDKELVDELLTFLAAGHETTSLAFTWTTYLLAQHKDIQSALRKEIQQRIPDPLPADFDLPGVLESLPLLNGVCNESLRLYPTVPVTVRVAVRDTTLCNTRIAAGTELLISPWATNRDPEL